MHLSVPKILTNQKLRAARMSMRLSQREFATAVRHAGASLGEPNECTKRLVQKWESGEHSAIRPNYRRALQAVTRIPYEQLGFAGSASEPVSPMLDPSVPAFARGPAVRGLPQSGTEGDRLRYALTRPGNADIDSIGLIAAHTTHLFELELTQPARLLAPQVAAHLDDVAAALCGTRRSSLRKQLAATGGRSAALAGWLAFDCGDIQGAHRWWDNALAAAQFAGDGPLLAWTLTYLSSSAAEKGDPATAWQLANTALSHAGPNPRARAWMAARAAQEAATLGERHAANVAMELALDLATGMSTPELQEVMNEQPWTGGIDLACLHAMAASTHGRLGDLRLARESAELALEAMVPAIPELLVVGSGASVVAVVPASRASIDPFNPATASGPLGPSGSPYLTDPDNPAARGDLTNGLVPDQSQAQVKTRAVTLVEIAYAAARVGETDLARSAGYLAANLAERLEISLVRRRLRALTPLLAPHREYK